MTAVVEMLTPVEAFCERAETEKKIFIHEVPYELSKILRALRFLCNCPWPVHTLYTDIFYRMAAETDDPVKRPVAIRLLNLLGPAEAEILQKPSVHLRAAALCPKTSKLLFVDDEKLREQVQHKKYSFFYSLPDVSQNRCGKSLRRIYLSWFH